MQVRLFEWADDGGPGGPMEIFDWRHDAEGTVLARLHGQDETRWMPWPKSYIELDSQTWAKYWRYCVHAPGDPLFQDADDHA